MDTEGPTTGFWFNRESPGPRLLRSAAGGGEGPGDRLASRTAREGSRLVVVGAEGIVPDRRVRGAEPPGY